MRKISAVLLATVALGLMVYGLVPLIAQPTAAAPAKLQYEYTVLRVSTDQQTSTKFLANYTSSGWEPVSIGGGEGFGSGQTAVLMRRLK